MILRLPVLTRLIGWIIDRILYQVGSADFTTSQFYQEQLKPQILQELQGIAVKGIRLGCTSPRYNG